MRLTRRKLNVVLIVAFAFAFGLSLFLPLDTFAAFIPSIKVVDNIPITLQIGQAPPIKIDRSIELDAQGTFSAYNHIHMHAVFYSANISNWNSYYCCIAIATTGPRIIFDSNSNFDLHSLGNGTYYADGGFTVLGPTDLRIALAPMPFNETRDIAAINRQVPSTVNITSVSDTLTLDFAESTIRISFILGSFSILLLQPILEGILFEDKRRP